MRISIIVACLNARPLLLRCLDSIARQDYCDIEVIVADGGSRDGTAETLRGWQAPSVSSFHWFSGPDAGIADAWNKAIGYLSGEWVLFLGADDVLAAPDILSRAAARLAELAPGTRVAYGQVALVDAQGRQVDLLERPWSPGSSAAAAITCPIRPSSITAPFSPSSVPSIPVLPSRRISTFCSGPWPMTNPATSLA